MYIHMYNYVHAHICIFIYTYIYNLKDSPSCALSSAGVTFGRAQRDKHMFSASNARGKNLTCFAVFSPDFSL